MKFTLIASVFALLLGSMVQAAPTPAPQLDALGGALSGITSLLGGGGGGGGGGGDSAADIQDETTR